MTEWLGSGLQNRVRRFESARGLQEFGEAKSLVANCFKLISNLQVNFSLNDGMVDVLKIVYLAYAA